MKTIDFTQRFITVGGRLPLAYLQDGHGFDARGNCLGRYTDNGSEADKLQREGDSQGLTSLKVDALKSLAAERGIYGADGMKKAELIAALEASHDTGGVDQEGSQA